MTRAAYEAAAQDADGGHEHRGRLRRWGSGRGFELGLAFALSLVMGLSNPFGHLTALEQHGRDLFNQLFAPAPSVYGTGARDRLTVVLLRDVDLEEGALHWPVPYAYHAGVLAEIRALGPAAVMVDFLFVDERRPDPTLVELVEEIGAYRLAGIPLFLASPPPGPAMPGPLARLAAGGARLVPVPRLVGGGGDHAYLLFDCGPAGHGDPCTPTAASTIYRELCTGPTAARWRCDGALLQALGRERPAHGAEVMEVVWSMAPVVRSDGRPACKPPPESFYARFRLILREGDVLRLDCPALPTLAPTRLLHVARDDEAVVQSLIERRVVFYGADLLGGADVIRPASHHRLSGVYFHAMAVDNLLTFGRDYKREVGRLGLTPKAVQVGVAFLLEIPVLWLFLAAQDRLVAWWRAGEGLRMVLSVAFKVGYWVAATGLVLLIAWFVEFRGLNLMPGNWLEGALEAIIAKHLGVNVAPFARRLIGIPARPAEAGVGH